MREETIIVAINPATMEIYLGSTPQTVSSETEGELDQEVLKQLGYVNEEGLSAPEIDKEVHRFLPKGLEVSNFEKEWTNDDEEDEILHFIRYYSDGQSDWFILELENGHGLGVKLENDPVSGKIKSEFIQ